MQNAGLCESQAGIMISGRNNYNLRYADDTTLMAESKETKESLDESERGKWKSWLKTQHSEYADHGIWSHLFMAIDEEKLETMTDFIFLGSKITEDGDCSHEIKRHLLLGRKTVTSIDSIWKSRDVTLLTKIHLVKGMVFPVLMYECEIWTIKKAEQHRIDSFELWCKRRLLRVAWTALRSVSPKGNQSWIFSFSFSFGSLMWRTDSLEKIWMLWKTEGKRKRRQQRMRWLVKITG